LIFVPYRNAFAARFTAARGPVKRAGICLIIRQVSFTSGKRKAGTMTANLDVSEGDPGSGFLPS